jgi:hypothetical protein
LPRSQTDFLSAFMEISHTPLKELIPLIRLANEKTRELTAEEVASVKHYGRKPANAQSVVWESFVLVDKPLKKDEKPSQLAICTRPGCWQIYTYCGSTSTLMGHLKQAHNIDTSNGVEIAIVDDDDSEETKSKKRRQQGTLDCFLSHATKSKKDLDVLAARVVVKDMSFAVY